METAINFFREEFTMNLRISQMNKPVFAVMDGITFGGGAGLAAYAPITSLCVPLLMLTDHHSRKVAPNRRVPLKWN